MMGRNNCTCQGERSKAQLMETIGQSAFAAYDTLNKDGALAVADMVGDCIINKTK